MKKTTAVKKTAETSGKAAAAAKPTETAVQPTVEQLDPVFITELDRYLFGAGRHYKIYQKMGAHPATLHGKKGMHFAVWAPHAKAVSIVCDRNQWNTEANYMLPLEDSGIYEGFIENMGFGEIYKFAIHTQAGEILYKADPYGYSAEFRPGTASKTADISNFPWHDAAWMSKRAKTPVFQQPMAIYECHLGSWRRRIVRRRMASIPIVKQQRSSRNIVMIWVIRMSSSWVSPSIRWMLPGAIR